MDMENVISQNRSVFNRTRCWIAGILLALACAFPFPSYSQNTTSPKAAQTPHHVLILAPIGRGGPGIDLYIDSLIATFKSSGISGSDIFVEYLDLDRNPSAAYRIAEKNLLEEKYGKRKIDAIFALFPPALNFLLKDIGDLAPDAPVIAVRAGMTPDLPRGRHHIVMTIHQFDYRTQLEQIMALFPDTRRIVMFDGVSEDNRTEFKAMEAAFQPWKEKVSLSHTADLSFEEAEKLVASLPPHTVIWDLGLRVDKTGRIFITTETQRTIAQIANAPSFVMYDYVMGKDFVGGYMFSVKDEGINTAKTALAIMDGSMVLDQEISQINSRQIPIYDWRQLKRWNADLEKLPTGSVLINRQSTLWDQYRGTVLEVSGAFALLIMLILCLWRQIRRKTVAEEALRASQERYRTLVEEAPEAITVYDAHQQRIIDHNSKAECLFGRSSEVLRSIEIDRLYVPVDNENTALREIIAENTKRVLSGESLVFERTVRRPDGTEIPCEIWLTRLPSKDRHLIRASIIDITDRKSIEKELLNHRHRLEEQVIERTTALSVALDQAQAASRAKSTFLSQMSHEIRTPMNAILGYAQLMERQPELTGKLRDYTNIIERSGDHLLALINDVLEMSKIEAGSVTLSKTDFDFYAMLKDAELMFKMRAAEKRLNLHFRIGSDVPMRLRADTTKVRQVLVNIIGNAIKFTDTGDVSVNVSAQKLNDGELLIGTTIVDTGPGIPADQQTKVFEAFEQTESGHRKGGTGLGMAISRQYARMMGGNLVLESAVGKGTTMRFTFKASAAENNKEIQPGVGAKSVIGLAPSSSQPRILIVDDVESNRVILRLALVGIGVQAIRELAGSANIVEEVREWRPDIILMDRRMPGMDGLAATRMIRATFGPTPRIIMVTASAFDEDRQAAFDAGAEGFIGKPFREEEILAQIQSLFPGIVYLYGEKPASGNEVVAGGADVNVEFRLDKALAAQLAGLIENGDVLRFEKCIAEHLRGPKPALYEHLHELAQRFDYGRILAILRPSRT